MTPDQAYFTPLPLRTAGAGLLATLSVYDLFGDLEVFGKQLLKRSLRRDAFEVIKFRFIPLLARIVGVRDDKGAGGRIKLIEPAKTEFNRDQLANIMKFRV